MPADLDPSIADHIIIATALSEKSNNPNKKVILVSRDINMRVICDAVGVQSEDYIAPTIVTELGQIYDGFASVLVDDELVEQFYNDEEIILENAEKSTKNNTHLQINLALNYGSKSELVNTINFLKKNKKNITEKNINQNLYTKNIPDPDLLIRTGNTRRLSNFLLWQIAYSEIYFVKKLWPEFNIIDYNKILNNYKNLKRNFGAI